MSSFFTTPASQKKRKRPDAGSTASRKKTTVSAAKPAAAQLTSQTRKVRDESISASGSDASEDGAVGVVSSESGDESSGLEDETADERRLRLAQRYLDNIRQEVNEDPYAFDAVNVDRDLIAERLKEDVAQNKGKLHRFVVEELDFSGASKTQFSADQNGVTAVATIAPHAFTASQDGSLCKWRLREPESNKEEPEESRGVKRRPELLKRFKAPRSPKESYQGHDFNSQILCVGTPTSGKYLVTGGTDRKIVVWDPASFRPIKAFTHHRAAVISLSFRRGTHTLYSASADRTCKVWSLDEMGYVQTLFGHQDQVVDIGGLASEQFVSVGARDRTARLFKVIEEQQLVFRGSGGGAGSSSKPSKSAGLTNGVNGDAAHPKERYEEGSIDRIGIVDEETFVTGSDNGALSLWSVQRKKPVFTVPLAHGLDPPSTLEEAYAEVCQEEGEILSPRQRPGRDKPRWITALVTIPLADLVLTGSWDGAVRVWRVTKDRRRLEAAGAVGFPPVRPSSDAMMHVSPPATNGDSALAPNGLGGLGNGRPHPATARPEVRGVINDLAVFERGEKGKDGLCVVAAVSKSHRLGNFLTAKGQRAKNGAVVFEVPVKQKDVGNGVASTVGGEEVDEGEVAS